MQLVIWRWQFVPRIFGVMERPGEWSQFRSERFSILVLKGTHLSTTKPIIKEQEFAHAVDVVWRAITDKDLMREWYFGELDDFQPVVGFETRFEVECEGVTYPHCWKVTEVIPMKKISYLWRYDGFAGESEVSWKLSEVPAGTKLTLTHSGGETFPQDNPVFSRESGVVGWTYFLEQSLPAFLESQSAV